VMTALQGSRPHSQMTSSTPSAAPPPSWSTRSTRSISRLVARKTASFFAIRSSTGRRRRCDTRTAALRLEPARTLGRAGSTYPLVARERAYPVPPEGRSEAAGKALGLLGARRVSTARRRFPGARLTQAGRRAPPDRPRLTKARSNSVEVPSSARLSSCSSASLRASRETRSACIPYPALAFGH
jgi:hypothetical protein